MSEDNPENVQADEDLDVLSDDENALFGGDEDEKDAEEKTRAKNSDDEDEDDENQQNTNAYERDGFVVSDDEGSDSGSSLQSEVKKKKKRKRKRLRRKGRVDEDDLELIRENMADDTEVAEQPSKRTRVGDMGDAASIDSDGLDEFIVDENRPKLQRRKSSRAREDQFERDLNYEEETELAELFVYDPQEFEQFEVDEVDQSRRANVRKSVSDRLREQFDQTQLAKNFMLKEDLAIMKRDVPERKQMMAKNMMAEYNKVNAGEFYLRFDYTKLSGISATVENDEEAERAIEKSIREDFVNERLRQAKWIYHRLIEKEVLLNSTREGDAVYLRSFPELKEAILYALESFQVRCMEAEYLFYHERDKVQGLSLKYLYDIEEQIQPHLKMIEARDALLKMILEHPILMDDTLSVNIEDESRIIVLASNQDEFVPEVEKLITKLNFKGTQLSETLLEQDKSENYSPAPEEAEGVNEFLAEFGGLDETTTDKPSDGLSFDTVYDSEKHSLKSALLNHLLDYNSLLTEQSIRALQKWIAFRFGQSPSAKRKKKVKFTPRPKSKSNKVTKAVKLVDDLFGGDDDDDEDFLPSDEEREQNANSETNVEDKENVDDEVEGSDEVVFVNRPSMGKLTKLFDFRSRHAFEKDMGKQVSVFLKAMLSAQFVGESLQRLLTQGSESSTLLGMEAESSGSEKDLLYSGNEFCYRNPVYLITSILTGNAAVGEPDTIEEVSIKFKGNVSKFLDSVCQLLSKEVGMSFAFQESLREIVKSKANVSCFPGPNFSNVSQDFGHLAFSLLGIKHKKFASFDRIMGPLDNEWDQRGIFLKLTEFQKQGLLSFDVNSEALNLFLLKKISEVALSKAGFSRFEKLFNSCQKLDEVKVDSFMDLTKFFACELDESLRSFFWDRLRLEVCFRVVKYVVAPKWKSIVSIELTKRASSVVSDLVYQNVQERACTLPLEFPTNSSLEYLKSLYQSENVNRGGGRDDFGILKVDFSASVRSQSLRVFSVFLSSEPYNFDFLVNEKKGGRKKDSKMSVGVFLDHEGEMRGSVLLPSLVDTDDLFEKLQRQIAASKPHFVLINNKTSFKGSILFEKLCALSEEHYLNAMQNQSASSVEDRKQAVFVPILCSSDEATAIAHSVLENEKFQTFYSSVEEAKAVYMGRLKISPLGELVKLFSKNPQNTSRVSNGNSIFSIVLHPYQSLLSQRELEKEVEKAFRWSCAQEGVDISSVLWTSSDATSNEEFFQHKLLTLERMLQFVPGLGPRKAKNLVSIISQRNLQFSTRLDLKKVILSANSKTENLSLSLEDRPEISRPDKCFSLEDVFTKLSIRFGEGKAFELLNENRKFLDHDIPGCVYENCIGFLRLGSIEGVLGSYMPRFDEKLLEDGVLTDDDIQEKLEVPTNSMNFLDVTKIHPKDYRLASLICWTVLRGDEDMGRFEEVSDNVEEEDNDAASDDGNDIVNVPKVGRDDFIIPEKVLAAIRLCVQDSNIRLGEVLGEKEIGFSDLCKKFLEASIKDAVAFPNHVVEAELGDMQDKLASPPVSLLETHTGDRPEEIASWITGNLRFSPITRTKEIPFPGYSTILRSFLPSDVPICSEAQAEIRSFTHRSAFIRLIETGVLAQVRGENIPANRDEDLDAYRGRMSQEQQLEARLGKGKGDVIRCWILEYDPYKLRADCTMIPEHALDLLGSKWGVDPSWQISSVKSDWESLNVQTNPVEEAPEPEEFAMEKLALHPKFNSEPSEAFKARVAKGSDFKNGEFWFRRSSSDKKALSLYWKLPYGKHNNILVKLETEQSVELPVEDGAVDEVDKSMKTFLSLGGEEKYEDLDEIIGTFISPINQFLTQVLSDKKHFIPGGDSELAKRKCAEDKQAAMAKSQGMGLIPYYIVPEERALKFSFYFLVGSKTVDKYPFTVTPKGFESKDEHGFLILSKTYYKLVENFKQLIKRVAKAKQQQRRVPRPPVAPVPPRGRYESYTTPGSYNTRRYPGVPIQDYGYGRR